MIKFNGSINKDVCKEKGVKSFPTILMYINGEQIIKIDEPN